MKFTHVATVIGGEKAENPEADREVLLDKVPVGRVKYDHLQPVGPPLWHWSTFCYPAAKGSDLTMEGALAALKADVTGKVVGGVLPMAGTKPREIVVGGG